MVGDGVRGMLVVELFFLGCCVDSRMSQESMLTYVAWPRMEHLCVSKSLGPAGVPSCSPMRILRMMALGSVSVYL